MAEIFGERRRQLLRHLLRHKSGATVHELTDVLAVTRTAVRQQLDALMRDSLVARSGTRPTGGRPEQVYVLTDAGREAFPRHYSWFAQLLIEAITKEHGAAGLRVRLGRIAAAVVAQLDRRPGASSYRAKIEQLSRLMDELGYDARLARESGGMPSIEADNCVFHELAMNNPEVCHFDLALLSGFSGARVELHECMARGGGVCRFHFRSRQQSRP